MNDIGSELDSAVHVDGRQDNREKSQIPSLDEGYLRILELPEIPLSPDQMPETITLPPEVVSNWFAASLEMVPGNNPNPFNERSGLTEWIDNKWRSSRTFKGKETEVSWLFNLYSDFLRFAGHKPVLYWHTHHGDHETSFMPSMYDAAGIMSDPASTFIYGVGCPIGISALLQTQASGNITKMDIKTRFALKADLARKEHARLVTTNYGDNVRDDAEIFRQKGLTLYYFVPGRLLTPEDFKNGLTLTKGYPSPDIIQQLRLHNPNPLPNS